MRGATGGQCPEQTAYAEVLMKIEIYDPTLRDGNHAVQHSLSLEQISSYCRIMDGQGLCAIEVGHGNGLGASSMQLGFSKHNDRDVLQCARAELKHTRLAVHAIPGFASLDDIRLAVDEGVDLVRVASHCTEADITRPYIELLRSAGVTAHGVLMMSHMATAEQLLEQARLLYEYGSQGVILMDSAGNYLPNETCEKVGSLAAALPIPLGFHAHNNMGLAIGNALAAVSCKATIIDATLNGFGAGAGNAAAEVLVAALLRSGHDLDVELFPFLDAAEAAERIVTHRPTITQGNLLSGLFGVFSGFDKPVASAAHRYGVDAKLIYKELGRRRVVAGQEDMILDIAYQLGTRV